MNISMRRIRARLSVIQGKVKLGITLILIVVSVLLIDHYLGIVSVVLEKDFETDFSYPLDVDNFKSFIENFRNGEAVDYEPINRLYTKLMIILVKSAPSNKNQRNAIRSTWGSPHYLKNISNFIKSKKVATRSNKRQHTLPRYKTTEPNTVFKLVFLIGLIPNHDYLPMYIEERMRRDNTRSQIIETNKSKNNLKSRSSSTQQLEEDLAAESSLYNDIVRIETIDSYTNNTFKTMMGIRFLEEICTDYEYALLADDDMYISLKNLLTFVESPATYPDGETDSAGSETIGQIVDANRLFAGKVLFTKPVRQRFGSYSKWHLSLEEYEYNHFPRYMPAGAIVMSKQVVEDFYYASYYTKHFRFDDVYLGIMAYKMNIIPFSCSYFHVCHSHDGSCSGLVPTKSRNQEADGSGEDEDNSDDLSVIEKMEYVIARHGLSTEQLIDLWRELTLSGRT